MRKILPILLLSLFGIGTKAQAASISFVGSVPANGSQISSFDIRLKFDISEVISEYGDNVAIHYNGFTSRDYNTRLYDGTPETGTLLATALTLSSYTAPVKGQDFLDLEIPSTIIPQPGHTYTLVCNNQFSVYDLETNKFVTGTLLDYHGGEPLILTFTGVAPGSNDLVLQSATVKDDENLASISTLGFDFNENIAIAQNTPVQIFKDNELYASSKSLQVNPANAKSLLADFGEVTLYRGESYVIRVPEGTVSLKSNSSVVNAPLLIPVNGTSTITVTAKSTFPENNSVALPETVTINFNLDPELTFTPPNTGMSRNTYLDIYKDEMSPENLVATFRGSGEDDQLTVDLSTFRYETETKYVLCKRADDISIWKDRTSTTKYSTEEVVFSFTTPSIEDSGFPPLEFGNPILRIEVQTNTDYEKDMEIPRIGTFYLELKDKIYTHDSKVYELYAHPNQTKCALYEVTPNGDRLLESYSISSTRSNDYVRSWSVIMVNFNANLYEGKKYKLVFPAESFTVIPPLKEVTDRINTSKSNYIKNDEFSFTFTGTKPSEFELLECSLEDNSTVGPLYNVIWKFAGDYKLNEDLSVMYKAASTSGVNMAPVKVESYITRPNTVNGDKTILMADFVSHSSGQPQKLTEGKVSTITLPKGLLVNALNPDLTNDEIVLHLTGASTDPAQNQVNVNIEVEGVHSYTHNATKGMDYTFNLAPAQNWEVESVLSDGSELSPVNVDKSKNVYSYELKDLQADANVSAKYKYAGEWAQNNEDSGVWSVADTNIRIYKDGESIVVEGVKSSNTINIYTVGGMLVNSTHVSEGNDCVRITVSPGQFYIVTVDGVAAKLKM